ncbi:ABC-2 type transporter [Hirsutella rhossiliensis]|uniref:ABC-2 type transporter domain-containing protein n=1 Tax=Hirsutella rhossiliensis TaxID=111463 RepID=A0A9P8SNI0_9HYPO|nr:ABC-2 type transporter domain-containing protein [Hirsutella rhossiliensis]KAH0968419.1 ABC-2 type transporter domain-containing protein [Hirsutella rhossiliensis]
MVHDEDVPLADSGSTLKSEQHYGDAEWELKPKVVAFRKLTVEAISAEAAIHENFVSQFNIPKLIKESRNKAPLKTILQQSHGCVKPGEMLLVLGRPGSGCTTLLNVLANQRRGYANVAGDVHYGSMKAAEAKQYSGQIIMNTEEELFFPTLTVGQTMDFATRLKVPFKLPDGVNSKEELRKESGEFLLKSMGIEHTMDTKVGNAGSVFCWDNSTRGLDASSALEFAKAIRAMTDVLGLASIVTLYQAGNGIYNLFDKVLVLDEGKEMYYGPMREARPFMERLGFVCAPGANVADYLTGVTVPTERKVRSDMQHSFPRTADAIRQVYEESPIHESVRAEYDYPSTDEANNKTTLFRQGVAMEKDKGLPAKSPMTVGFLGQVKACIARQYQILWGDKATFLIKQISTIVQALIAGSLFYNAPSTSAGLFMKSGACFFAILFNSLLSMSEVTDSFTGRPVLLKHKSFALFHPAAFCIAQIAADIPVILFQVSTFSLILYFMVGLTMSAETFFTFWIIVVATTMCMTALFRAIGASFSTFDGASKVSGFTIAAAIMYTGYMIQKPQMHPWFVWIFWIDPLAYAFDALLSNEFHDKIIPCVGNNLIPSGPGFTDSSRQACAGVGGAVPGQTFVTGDNYLASLSYSHSHLWRNFGIVWAWWALFVAITVWSTSRWRSSSENGPSLLIPRESARRVGATPRQADEEGQTARKHAVDPSSRSGTDVGDSDAAQPNLIRNTSVFTWRNLSYTVKTPAGDRLLLDNVQGWVEPGKLTALMGASGAGKTTLLDVLARRKTEGTIRGSVMVDGRPLPVSFQRSAGYCEQLDVHEPFATVREALEFSALLRQSRETARAEKLAYVDAIIDLLELHDLADTLIGEVGAGLSVEQRKRVTIGVELVSKPSILIFLDEPTSGLDGQSAFHTVRFLRKLAAVGQAVLVTIHQPSAQLFAQFDRLLLLAKGGKTVYFGDIGDQARTIREYFGRHGARCPPEANPAEHMIDVVSGGQLSQGHDWSAVWLESPEHAAVSAQLDRIVREAAAKPPGTVDDGHEFATPLREQIRLVTRRMNVSLYRNTDYVNNKLALHVFSALFNGFSFWMVGDSVGDLQLKLFTIFNFIFVAPGVLAQLQPLFIHRRDIFETREKKSKTYSWVAFVTGLVLSEMPYLLLCGVVYFVCWYYTVGFPAASQRAGATLFVMLAYEFLYTGIGQFVAAYAPNVVFASLVNPLLLGTLVSFCGVLVPYQQIQPFWRYWMYYLNPFNYLMGSMLVFDLWGSPVRCAAGEFAVLDPPNGTSCAAYLADFLAPRGPGAASNLVNPDATAACRVCSFTRAEDYLATLNLGDYSYGWRDAGIVVLMVFSSYALVYALMKLRTKSSKEAE